jgi:alkylmercury lyase
MTEHASCSDAAFLTTLEGHELLPHIVRLIANGEPVSVQELAAAANWPQAEVERVLRAQPGTDWNDDGRLAGLGITLRPTRHRFVVDGHTLYAWCATDTLYFPILLGTTAIVESTCPASSQPIHIEISPHAVESVAPPETVVSQRHHAELFADVRAELCDHGHFFASRHAADAWLDAHPDGELLPVADAFTRCRATSEELGWITPTAARRR